MKTLELIGIDGWCRPVYKDVVTSRLWKDVECGRGKPDLFSAFNNHFEGEPDSPIQGEYQIVEAE